MNENGVVFLSDCSGFSDVLEGIEPQNIELRNVEYRREGRGEVSVAQHKMLWFVVFFGG